MPLTYKYYKPDSFNADVNLNPDMRDEYGGEPMRNFGDAAEPDGKTLSQRHVFKQLGFPKNSTDGIMVCSDENSNWIRCSDRMWSSVSPHLTQTERDSAVSAKPADFTQSNDQPKFRFQLGKFNWFEDSNSYGEGLGSNKAADGSILQDANGNDIDAQFNAMSVLAMRAAAALDPSYGLVKQTAGGVINREFSCIKVAVQNISIGGSSFNNTKVVSGNPDLHVYPRNKTIAANQRVRTLPIQPNIRINWNLRSIMNDIAYDPDVTSQQAYDRLIAYYTLIRGWFPKASFPLLTFSVPNALRRTEEASLNQRNHDFNLLLDANAINDGIDFILDEQGTHPSFHCLTGNSEDTSVFLQGDTTAGVIDEFDRVHQNNPGYLKRMEPTRDLMIQQVALL